MNNLIEMAFVTEVSELCADFTKKVFDLADKYGFDKAEAFDGVAESISDFNKLLVIVGADKFVFE